MAFNVRNMTRQELATVLQWAAEEGWNPGLNDADAFFKIDPKGFFLGELDGQPIGSCSAVAYDDHFGWIGLYMVRPQFRGQGYGVDIWDTGMLYLGARNAGLACAAAQQSYYEECGFVRAFRSVRHEGIGGGVRPKSLVDLTSIEHDELADYDARWFPARRPKFLKAWCCQAGTVGLASVTRGKLSGYGVIRKCHVGYKIGPLFADTVRSAESLLKGLAASVPGESYFLDVPEPNAAGMTLAQRQQLRPKLESAWMFTRSQPYENIKRMWGMTSRGLG